MDVGEEEELQGFDPNVLEQMDRQNQDLQNENTKLTSAMVGSNFPGHEDETLIHYQLETDKFLGRIEHFLRGDIVKVDDKGSIGYTTPKRIFICKVVKDLDGIKYTIDIETKKIWEIVDTKSKFKTEGTSNSKSLGDGRALLQDETVKLITMKELTLIDSSQQNFNEYGVAELMRIMSMYITKETFLSNYEEDRINEIIADLGDAIADFIYCNYERMGMDTKYKESKYVLIVENLLHAVESCYRRALGGEEMKGLRQRAIVTQTNMGNNQMGAGIRRPKKHPFKPSTW